MRSFWRVFFTKQRSFARNPHNRPRPRTIMSGPSTALLYAATVSAPNVLREKPSDEITQKKAHHVASSGGFDNPWPSWHSFTVWSIFSALVRLRLAGKSKSPDTTPPTVPVQAPEFLPDRKSSTKLRATWLGHACYYVEFPSGLRVLFDPVFEDRCSPLSFLGPKRFTPQPCHIADIPIIDAVVISHNHYDHLSLPTVTEIAQRHPRAHFFVPLGNKAWFTRNGLQQCTELDWWDDVEFTLTPQTPYSDNVDSANISSSSNKTASSSPDQPPITARISCLPCQHTSARTPFDKAQTLWSSWAVTSSDLSVYFAGDTGYRSVPEDSSGQDDYSDAWAHLPHCPAFAQVGEHRGPFDLGLIPIGAYSPRFIMSPMHANPRDAVEIFKDTRCKRALGMHWGTWVLTDEPVLEPPQLLKEALKVSGIDQGRFGVCNIGESREFEKEK
ncbi:hypothetical protein DV738_g4122, partial [Chaetothyriales sp. CBS 135597]